MRDDDVLNRWDRDGPASLGWRDWILVYSDIHRFADVGLKMINDAHQRAWDQAAAQPSNEVFWDVGEAYDNLVGGLNSVDHEWMYLAAALKDSVTAFEVYLAALAEEILIVHGLIERLYGKLSPWWKALKRWYRRHLDLDLDSHGVAEIREIRHALAHRRGVLRTEAERKAWGRQEGFGGRTVDLQPDGVRGMMEILAGMVSIVEEAGVPYTRFGGKRFGEGQLTLLE